MKYETLIYEQEGAIGILTLNRPERLNAINEKMIGELEEFWMKKMLDLDTRVIILTGAGNKGFCGGLDIKESFSKIYELESEKIYEFQVRIARLQLLMRQIPQPIIIAIHKAAVGGGFSFAMASDVRIITPEARFSAAYINIGLGGADMGRQLFFVPDLLAQGALMSFY